MRVTVFGSARLGEDTPEYRDAVRLGNLICAGGHILLSGGYGGLMEAVSRGAHEAGGKVIGITMTPWKDRLTANRYLSEERAAETLFARIEALIETDALIALPGGAGTLGEVAMVWNLRQMELMPNMLVILVGASWQSLLDSFRANLVIGASDLALLAHVDTVEEAAEMLRARTADESAPMWRG